MKRGTTLLLLGLLLFALSAYPLFQQTREAVVSRYAQQRYEVRPVTEATEADFAENEIALHDSFQETEERDWQPGRVQIAVNDRDYSYPVDLIIRTAHRDGRRYHREVALAEVRDKQTNTSQFAVIQRIAGERLRRDTYRYRLLLVQPDGNVREEVFGYNDRALPVYRGLLVNSVTPVEAGFFVDQLERYPTPLYPFLYPLVSGLLGLTLIVIAAAMRKIDGKPNPM